MRRGRLENERRRKEAEERDAYRATLSLEARLSLCDDRPGESKRERARIMKQIAERDVAPKPDKKKKQDPARQDKKALKAAKKKKEADA